MALEKATLNKIAADGKAKAIGFERGTNPANTVMLKVRNYYPGLHIIWVFVEPCKVYEKGAYHGFCEIGEELLFLIVLS